MSNLSVNAYLIHVYRKHSMFDCVKEGGWKRIKYLGHVPWSNFMCIKIFQHESTANTLSPFYYVHKSRLNFQLNNFSCRYVLSLFKIIRRKGNGDTYNNCIISVNLLFFRVHRRNMASYFRIHSCFWIFKMQSAYKTKGNPKPKYTLQH